MISKMNIWGHGKHNATSPTETDLPYRDSPFKNKCKYKYTGLSSTNLHLERDNVYD